MITSDSGSKGTIYPALDVGTQKTCPPGRGCPGQGWTADFCSIFGSELERAPNNGRKHVYRKCAPCIKAMREQREPPTRSALPIKRNAVDIFKDE